MSEANAPTPAPTPPPAFEAQRLIHDTHGREISVTHDARGYVYAREGYQAEFSHKNDARVIEMVSMVDAPIPALDRGAAARQIDEACREAMAPKLPFLEAYKERESQALAFQAAAYVGETPIRVAEFATPAQLTPMQATEMILEQAQQMRALVSKLEGLRMRKYEVLLAVDDAGARAALAEILGGVASIGQALA